MTRVPASRGASLFLAAVRGRRGRGRPYATPVVRRARRRDARHGGRSPPPSSEHDRALRPTSSSRRGRRPSRGATLSPGGRPRDGAPVPGIHPAGIDEPRLVALGAGPRRRRASRSSRPDLPDLSRFDITPAPTDHDRSTSAAWLASAIRSCTARRPHRDVGISFSGGPVGGRGRPGHRWSDGVAFVMSFGGHGDLPRVLRYLCTRHRKRTHRRTPPRQTHRADEATNRPPVAPPHDYGVAMVLLGVADRVVPPRSGAAAARGIGVPARPRRSNAVDMPQAEREFARAPRGCAALPEPSTTCCAT